MSRQHEFIADPAFAKAVEGAHVGLKLATAHGDGDPRTVGRMIAMAVLVAFVNAGGLDDPHIGRLMRFALATGAGGEPGGSELPKVDPAPAIAKFVSEEKGLTYRTPPEEFDRILSEVMSRWPAATKEEVARGFVIAFQLADEGDRERDAGL